MDGRFVRIQGHEIIGIADDTGNTIRTVAFPSSKPLCYCLFQSVQSHVGEQRAEHPALWNSLRAGEQVVTIQDSGFQPCFDDLAKLGKGLEFGEQYRLIDPVERPLTLMPPSMTHLNRN